MSSLAKRLQQLREAADLTQEQVAKAIKRTQKAVSLLERGDRQSPNSKTLQALAKLYDVDPEWLLTGHGDKKAVTSLTPDERELLLLFRALSPAGKTYLLARLQEIYRGEYEKTPSSKSPESGTRDKAPPEGKLFN